METLRPTTPEAEEILFKYFPVLDHGFLSLIDYSGTDQCIERAARVSYGGGTRQVSKTRGLLRYLRRHWHTSPFELVNLKLHMCAPIFVLRQFFRHRTLSANEYSGRYSLMPMLFYTPDSENFQKQSRDNNQGRSGKIEDAKYKAAVDKWNNMRSNAASFYEDLTAAEVARELARIDLPLSTYSQLYFTMNLHNMFHFLNLRVDSHAQYEIREYANVMAGMVKRVAPLSYEAWIDYNAYSASFSRMEMDIMRNILTLDFKDGKINASLKSNTSIPEGMSTREIRDLCEKFNSHFDLVDYDLDLNQAKSANFFQEKMNAAVPNIDVK